jgi:hypothetical protein
MKEVVVIGMAVVAGAGVSVALIARAEPPAVDAGSQAQTFPAASEVTPAGMTVQTQEPPTGFTGACLVNYATYQPTLPLICYSPGTMAQYGKSHPVTFPAQKVFRAYDGLPARYDSYLRVATCYPRDPDAGTCPSQSFAVSHSCCDFGMHLVSVDGQTATGVVGFTSSGAAAAADSGAED